MKKIGKFNYLEKKVCKLKCDCGWHITIGGDNKNDLVEIKKFLKNHDPRNFTKKTTKSTRA